MCSLSLKYCIYVGFFCIALFFLSGDKLSSKSTDLKYRFAYLKSAPKLSNTSDYSLSNLGRLQVGYKLSNVEQRKQYALNNLKSRHHLTPSANTESYENIQTHPLILEAVDILTKALKPYARGVYVTSMSRSWDDQWRLSHHRRSRYWTTSRSKHLVGMAADIGFVGRRRNSWKLHALAERTLRKHLGAEKASLLRIVRERHCLHIEIDTKAGRHLIEERSHILENMGIISIAKKRPWNPVPEMSEYLPLKHWLKVEKEMKALSL